MRPIAMPVPRVLKIYKHNNSFTIFLNFAVGVNASALGFSSPIFGTELRGRGLAAGNAHPGFA